MSILAMTFLSVFMMCSGFGATYLAFKREAFIWDVMAIVLFVANVGYGGSIPFVTNEAGLSMGSTANHVLMGISLLFMMIPLMHLLYLARGIWKR